MYEQNVKAAIEVAYIFLTEPPLSVFHLLLILGNRQKSQGPS